eukprot:COSAG06_NODE_812_length_12162_cov_19.489182_3_plen_154_part_00
MVGLWVQPSLTWDEGLDTAGEVLPSTSSSEEEVAGGSKLVVPPRCSFPRAASALAAAAAAAAASTTGGGTAASPPPRSSDAWRGNSACGNAVVVAICIVLVEFGGGARVAQQRPESNALSPSWAAPAANAASTIDSRSFGLSFALSAGIPLPL